MRLMYINGEFTKGSATEAIEVTNPATEEVLDTVPRGTAEDVEAAVREAPALLLRRGVDHIDVHLTHYVHVDQTTIAVSHECKNTDRNSK